MKEGFSQAKKAIDPSQVPKRHLADGSELPAIGLGTFGSDCYGPAEVAAAVKDAIAGGYRHIDCAAVYNNEKEIGEALQEAMTAGVAREDLWITSKLWNDKHAEEDVIPACEQSLRDLHLDYLDLYLIHWPFPNFHPPGCDVSSRSPDAQPYVHENYMKTWRQLEKLVAQGKVRHIGTSNMTIPKLELLLRDAEIPPCCNEMELHPHFQQPELFDYIRAHGMIPIGYCPLGSPKRPDRDKQPEDTVPMEDPVIVGIAEKHGIHPATVCLKWAIQRGQVPIPFSVHRDKYMSNLRATVTEPLTAEDMAAIEDIDKNCRFIKGQVFLWKEDQTWEALWDLHGHITPP